MSSLKNKVSFKSKFLFMLACLLTLLSLNFSTVPATVYAQGSASDCKSANVTAGNCKIVKYIVTFTNILSAAVGVIVTIMVAWGGVQYTMSKDDPQATAQAKERIRNALLALVIYIFMFAFLQWLVPGGIF
jgi:hypothetical protein